MNQLIVVADLGRMKVYRVTKDDLQPGTSPAFEDLADVDLENQHSKVSKRTTDKAGRFAYGSGSKAVGERHSEEEQAETQQLQAIANAIHEVVGPTDEPIHLAAPKVILENLRAALPAGVQARIHGDLPLNLVKAPKLELMDRFGIT